MKDKKTIDERVVQGTNESSQTKEKNVSLRRIFVPVNGIYKRFPKQKDFVLTLSLDHSAELGILTYNNESVILDEKQTKILKAKMYKKNLKITKMYQPVLDMLVKLHTEYHKEHNISLRMLKRNLENLTIQKKPGYLKKVDGAYLISGNTLSLRYYKPKNEMDSLNKTQTLSHEIGHMTFGEMDTDGEYLIDKGGVSTGKYRIFEAIELDNNKGFLIDIDETSYTCYGYGIEEALNEEYSLRVLGFDVSQYNSAGQLIEYIVGTRTCDIARSKHDLNMIKAKFVELIPDGAKFDELIENLDNVFDDNKKCSKKERAESEVKSMSILADYVLKKVETELKTGKFKKSKYEKISEWRIPFHLNKDLEILEINDRLNESVEKLVNQYKPKKVSTPITQTKEK